MHTGGYDIAAQIDENVFNDGLAVLYYGGMLWAKNTYTFSSSGIPAALHPFAEVTYKIKVVSPPLLDFVQNDTAAVLLNAQVVFYLLGSIEVEIDVDVDATAKIVYNDATHKVALDFSKAKITSIRLDDTLDLDKRTLKKLNNVIKFIVVNDIFHNLQQVVLPLSLFQFEIPTVPPAHKIPINRMDVKIVGDTRFQAAVDLFTNTGGNFNSINLGPRCDFGMAIRETVINQIIHFWWTYTTMDKSITQEKTESLGNIEDIVNTAVDVGEVLCGILTLGFVSFSVDFSNSALTYGAKITFGEPHVDLLPSSSTTEGKFSLLNTHVFIDVWAKATTDVDVEGYLFWGALETSHETYTGVKLFDLHKSGIDVEILNAQGRVYLKNVNNQVQLVGKIDDFDINVDLGSDFTDNLAEAVINTIIDWIKGIILNSLPEFPLCPQVVTVDVPVPGYHANVTLVELSTTHVDALIRLDVDILELKTISAPIPGFIGNKFTKEVHRVYCNELDEMNEINKVGYYSLMAAINEGYDTCGICIPSYSKH